MTRAPGGDQEHHEHGTSPRTWYMTKVDVTIATSRAAVALVAVGGRGGGSGGGSGGRGGGRGCSVCACASVRVQSSFVCVYGCNETTHTCSRAPAPAASNQPSLQEVGQWVALPSLSRTRSRSRSRSHSHLALTLLSHARSRSHPSLSLSTPAAGHPAPAKSDQGLRTAAATPLCWG